MNYPHIVANLDLQIERLRQARALLLERPAVSVSLPQDPMELSESPASGQATPPAGPAPVVARRIAPRLRSNSRRARQQVAEPTALSGSRPTGPVFIPAAQVHPPAAAHSAAAPPAQPRVEGSAPPEDGTLESLLRQAGQARNGSHGSPEAQAREFFGV